MHKLEFTLRQHTPLIHFQHTQEGATLRATEVKPKLDRFLIRELKLTEIKKIEGQDKEVPKHEFKDLFINEGKQHLALNYKVQISCPNSFKTKNGKSFPMFFGNMGNEYEKGGVLAKSEKSISIMITSFKADIVEKISENIAVFFFKHNFGTRQSKGFGSFIVGSELMLNGVEIENKFEASSDYRFQLNVQQFKGEWDKHIYLLSAIDLFYRSLRQGINRKKRAIYEDFKVDHTTGLKINSSTEFYLKPAIFLYAKSRGHQWDKKTIKEKFFNRDIVFRNPSKKEREKRTNNVRDLKETEKIFENGLKNQLIEHNSSDVLSFKSDRDTSKYYDYKDVLGLSSVESWKSYGDTISKTASNQIERFKSPLMFKPIWKSATEVEVFILLAPIDSDFLKAKIEVASSKNSRSGTVNFEVPNFEIDEFLQFTLENYDIDSFVAPSFRPFNDRLQNFDDIFFHQTFNYYQILKSIYQSLKANNHAK